MLQSGLRLPKRNVDVQYGSQTQPAQLVCVCLCVRMCARTYIDVGRCSDLGGRH